MPGGRATQLFALGLCALSPACADDQVPDACEGPAPALAASSGLPRYDQVWQIATHNSYWVDRGVQGDVFASGTEERLADQILFDRARAIELDVHRDPAVPGGFRIFHTEPGNSLCATLDGCLGELRALHRALPRHEVMTVILELKEITEPNFDAEHTIEDLDRVLVDELGELLYRPSDLLARCGGDPSCPVPLARCADLAGWPTIEELRGRFVIALLGNWDEINGQGTRDWASYALAGDLAERAAFPMASAWKLDWGALSVKNQERITQDELDRAFAESAFLQIQDLADARMPPFLATKGMVRIDGAFTPADQQARIELGAQLLQTDYPWDQHDDRGHGQPLRALDPSIDPAAMMEPGHRLLLSPGGPSEEVFAFLTPPGAVTSWETTAATGSGAGAVGCLRAASADGLGSITLCRDKGAAEEVIARIETCRAAGCSSVDVAETAGAGDLLGLVIENAAGGRSCTTARAAGSVGRDLEPSWRELAHECFDAPLTAQGIAAVTGPEGGGPILFVGTRRADGSGSPVDVRAVDLAGAGAGEIDDLSTP